MTAPSARLAGLGVFLALAFFGSWWTAATLRVFDLTTSPGALGTRLLATSLLYGLTMGWAPLVAVLVARRHFDPSPRIDLGLRTPQAGYLVVGVAAPIVVAVAATLVAWSLAALGFGGVSSSWNGSAEMELVDVAPSLADLGVLGVAFVATAFVLWLQAVTEELAWRGYFLPRAMEHFGRWRGLVLHGVVWGVWYAPVIFFASYGPLSSPDAVARAVAFGATCVLLGVLLGWLRLASRSIAPAVTANTTLTLAAGLPYVLHGVDAGQRSAVFLPAGWLVLVPLVLALFTSRLAGAVRTPARLGPAGGVSRSRSEMLH